MVGFVPETRSVRSKPSMVKNPAKIVNFRRKCAKFGGNLTKSSEISLDPVRFPPDLIEISLDSVISPQIRPKSHKNLKDSDQKLTRKFLFRRILVRLWSGQLRWVLEERTRHPTYRSWFLGSVTYCRPTGALRSIRGGSVLVGSGQLGRV